MSLKKASTPRLGQVLGLGPGGFHRMVYYDWGQRDAARVLVCVHGLTRNGRDFDRLASTLASQGWRVVCPDIVGRGQSDWLLDAAHYHLAQYCTDLVALLARLDVAEVAWLGTSMGGLIGMLLASKAGSPIGKLILNDVGPVLSREGLKRIAGYLAASPSFATLAEVEAHLRRTLAPFGALSDEDWRHLAQHAARPDGQSWRLQYDPRIGQALSTALAHEPESDLWPVYDAIRCPTLVLRGQNSDLLAHETVLAMSQRGPQAQWIEFPGCGHAPALMSPAQIAPVSDFLLR